MSLWQLVQQGGFIMIPLIFCSILIWTIALERTWTFLRFKQEMLKVMPQIREMVESSQFQRAKDLLMACSPLLSGPLVALIEKRGKDSKDFARKMVETDLELRKMI